MQKAISLFLAALFIGFTSIAPAQTEADIINYKLTTGDILTYEIVQYSKKQILKLELTSVPDGVFDFAKVTFDWTKTGDDINQSGKVKFTGNYMDDYNLNVSSSFRIDFDKLNYYKIFTSQGLWLGVKAQMDILLSGGEFGIKLLGDTAETNYQLKGKFYYTSATYYGKPCRLVFEKYYATTNENNFLMVLPGKENPLILAVYIPEKDFLIQLVSIEKGKLNTVAATPAPAAPAQTVVAVSSSPSAPSVKPDSDRDGITDDLDKCKNEAEDRDGFEDSDGCPENDNDNDGVDDMYDKCPQTKGSTNNGGCP